MEDQQSVICTTCKRLVHDKKKMDDCNILHVCLSGPGWLNELGSWITYQLIQAYHQYGMGSRPAL